MWAYAFDLHDYDFVGALAETADGGFLIAGDTSAGLKAYVIKLSTAGTLESDRTIGKGGENFIHAALEVPDHGLILSGRKFVFENDFDDRLFFLRLDARGKIPGCPLIHSRKLSVTPLLFQESKVDLFPGNAALSPSKVSLRTTKPQIMVSDPCIATENP